MRDLFETELELEPTLGLSNSIVFGDDDDCEDYEEEGVIYDEY